jgi:hypothetical protein
MVLPDSFCSCFLQPWRDSFSLGASLAHWATVLGVVGALIATYYALQTYRSNNSIRKWELIEKTYHIFLKDNWYDFYKTIQNGENVLGSPDGEKLLNETLTLFDALNYFRAQRLLDKRAWEYVACEVQNFALNNSVWEYIDRIREQYRLKGFPLDIIPFTGFPELFDNLPSRFKARLSAQLEQRFDALSPVERDSYFDRVKNIPDKQLRRVAAISLFAKAKVEEGPISNDTNDRD